MGVNAQHVKNVPGRKTDVADAVWLADVVAHGMVRPSFVPPQPIRELRELTRYRKTQVDAKGREIQRLEKLLQDACVKLTSVTSPVWSKSSRAMIDALIAGERDPANLADLAQSRMRSKIPELTEALAANWRPHHSLVARRIIAHIDFLDATIAALSGEIAERVAPQQLAAWAGSAPGTENPPADIAPPAPDPEPAGSDAPSPRALGRRSAPSTATSTPTTTASPDAAANTRPSSPSPTASSSSAGT